MSQESRNVNDKGTGYTSRGKESHSGTGVGWEIDVPFKEKQFLQSNVKR